MAAVFCLSLSSLLINPSAVLMFLSHEHDDKFGPKCVRAFQEGKEKVSTRGTGMSPIPESSSGPLKYNGNDEPSSPYGA